MKTTRGFTLIELLVVIAIIGILSSVVLASLNTARLKSRDTRRVADVKQLQLALALYFDSNAAYPSVISGTSLAPLYIAVIPTDPVTRVAYTYSAGSTVACATDKASNYHIGATLEDSTNQALTGDADATPVMTNICTGAAADFLGSTVACTGATVATGETCFDVKP